MQRFDVNKLGMYALVFAMLVFFAPVLIWLAQVGLMLLGIAIGVWVAWHVIGFALTVIAYVAITR